MAEDKRPPPLPKRGQPDLGDIHQAFQKLSLEQSYNGSSEEPGELELSLTPPLPPRRTTHTIPRKEVAVHTRTTHVDTSRSLPSPPRSSGSDTKPCYNDHFVLSPRSTMSSVTGTSASTAGATTATSTTDGEKSSWKKGFEEARYLAGGLVAHPHESTKHYSVLRHSHGLVYYQGPATRVPITIFADRALPRDRTIWLQKKGWLGKAGWAARSLVGSNGSWVEVTPERTIAEQTFASESPNDERAWQRDVKKFLKKAPKELKHHSVRETDIVRIPDTDLGDGYFRLVVCEGGEGKKVLCPSPVFRVASLSTSSASIKGASLGNLPLEVGVSIASQIAAAKASAFVAPVTDVITSTYEQYAPGFIAQEAATTVYDSSGVPDKIDNANERYGQVRAETFQGLDDGESARRALTPTASEEEEGGGPKHPFPICMESKIVPGTGKSRAMFGLPTANLKDMPHELKYRLSGMYFGWARIHDKPTSSSSKSTATETSKTSSVSPSSTTMTENESSFNSTQEEWHASIISIHPSLQRASQVIANDKSCTVFLIYDFHNQDFHNHLISVIIMGKLDSLTSLSPICPSSSPSPPSEDQHMETIHPLIQTTQHLLSAPGYTLPSTLALLSPRKDQEATARKKSITDRYVSARAYASSKTDKVPVWRAGVRTESAMLRDGGLGRGGVCIRRGGS